MQKYHYQGRDKQGKPQEGTVEAVSQEAAATKLIHRGITPIHINKAKAKIDVMNWINLPFTRVTHKQLMLFSRQMYTLIKAGVPVINALSQLAETTYSPVLAKTLRGIVEVIHSGQSLTTAMHQYPKIFTPFMINTVQVGENSGHLDRAFLHMTEYLELETETLKQLKTAFRYPLIVVATMLVATMIVSLVMIPSFAKLFNNFNVPLPWSTRVLIATSNFIIHYWPHVLVGIILTVGGLIYLVHLPRPRMLWHNFKLRPPVIGSIVKRILLARFSRAFSLVLRSGVPVIKGIELAGQAVGNDYIYKQISIMRQHINHGETLTNAAAATKLFPPLVLQMLSVGEQSGNVDNMLDEVAEFYDREIDYEIKRLTDTIQPLLVILVAGMVLILALGTYLPIWNLTKLAGGR